MRKIKILYDYHAFVMQSRGGVSRVLYELFINLLNKNIDCKIFAGFHRNHYLNDAPIHIKKYIIGIFIPEVLFKQRLFTLINRFLFRIYAFFYKPSICHYTYFDTPKVPNSTKVIVTVHDMIHELFPDIFSARDPQSAWKKKAINRADGIICVSNNTLYDLGKYFDISTKHSCVIYHGNSFKSIIPKEISFNKEYLLYIGSRSLKYKNFSFLLNVFSKFVEENNFNLICFGGGSFSNNELNYINSLNLSDRVFQVHGSDAELAGYYKKAFALVYPSLYEGFGLPPIEAMTFGCPVIASNSPPMPEVISNGGLYFNPDNESELIDRIKEFQNNDKYIKLSENGYKRSKFFCWKKSADQALEFYHKVLSG